MKHRVVLLLTLGLLVGCSNNTLKTSSSVISSSTSEETHSSSVMSSSEEVVSSSSRTSKATLTPLSLDIGSSSLVSSSGTKYTSSVVSTVDNSISAEEFEAAIMLAYSNDSEYQKIKMTNYSYKGDYFTASSYTMTAYSNQVTVYEGSTRLRYYNDAKPSATSTFVEQRSYIDGVLTQIRKYDNTFSNYAYKYKMTTDRAAYYLNIGQSFTAYEAVTLFAENYEGITFQGSIDDYGTYRGTYLYIAEDSLNQYNDVFIAVVDIKIDENFYLTDLFYSEGYYDAYYVDDIDTIRRHGPTQPVSGNTSYFTQMDVATKGTKFKCTSLPLSIEENFITSLSFSEYDITVKLSELKEGEKYINLLPYVVGNPECGETSGAPVNNLVFTSSDEEVATIGDVYYLDFIKPGYVEIDVTDSATGAKSDSPLCIFIEE